MLKRLELVGFKSFADKTRFDFAPGITGVVGPNGSGKSNVVDAVRWILGEQSAKSLRGGEMADVIFNGSSSRKSLGLAEVTVAFDNARRLLAVDADEVELTRRVYRDGTGEYLINGHIARLKDFKEMFLGSGAGANGYTIIAQGRVDELLQASTKDRREIFDEAAGSAGSRRKLETLRKLAAVEVNLTRSKDRLDTIESQLRTLRMQAAKAQKYKEYSDRLRELRVGLGLREYRELSETLETEQLDLARLQAEVAGANRQTGELEQALRELDREVSRSDDGLRHQEGRLADARQEIASFESTLKHERAAAAEYDAELLKIGRQRAELGYRIKSIETDATRAASEAAAAEERLSLEHQAAAARYAMIVAADRVAALDREIAADRPAVSTRQRRRGRALDRDRRQRVERLQGIHAARGDRAAGRPARRWQKRSRLSRADANVQAQLIAARDRMSQLQLDRDEITDRVDRVQRSLESLRVRQGDLRGRVEILEDLERTLDGLGAGVRHVVEKLNAIREARSDSSGPHTALDEVIGLVADLLTVPHEIAPLVELALGETAQRFVVRSDAAVDAVASAIGEVPGRVGFIPFGDAAPVDSPSSGFGTIEPLASRVTSELSGLPEQLLGNVFIVDSLADARALHVAHPGCRVVTRAGELLEPDGTLTVGPRKAEAGLVSRKSELRELREQFRALTEQIAITGVEFAELRRRADSTDGVIEGVESEIALLSGESGDLQQKIARQLQQVEQLDETIELGRQEVELLEQEVQRGEAAWVAAKLEADEAERAEEELRIKLADAQHSLRHAGEEHDLAQQANTAAQVTLSRAAADRDRFRERATQLDADLRKRRVEAVDLAATDSTGQNRREHTLSRATADKLKPTAKRSIANDSFATFRRRPQSTARRAAACATNSRRFAPAGRNGRRRRTRRNSRFTICNRAAMELLPGFKRITAWTSRLRVRNQGTGDGREQWGRDVFPVS